MFNPESDLTAIQRILINDPVILSLMDLSSASAVEKAKRIIKRNKWDDLTGSDKRLCIYFKPSQPTPNEAFIREVVQIDCHVPLTEDFKAYQIQERVKILLHKLRVNKRYTYFAGQLGELPTLSGFFCCGSRCRFYRNI